MDEDIEDYAVLIDRSPEVMRDAVDLEENFIQMPLITDSSTPSPETGSIFFSELIAPASDRFVADEHSACRHHLFHIPEAHTKSMAAVPTVRHSSSMPSV